MSDTAFYDAEIDREAFGHVGLNLRAIGTAPGKNTMALIEKLGAELAAQGPLGAPARRTP